MSEREKIRGDAFQKYLIVLCWLVYTVAQIARYSYSVNITLMIDRYAISHAVAGLPSTFYFFAYGVGQIVTAAFCKKYNKRLVVTAALIFSALCNCALFFPIDFAYVKYIWLINGFAQSNLWPLLMFMLGENVSEKFKRMAGIFMSSATALGTFLSYGIGALFAVDTIRFRYTFLIAALLVAFAATFWFFR